MIFLFSLCGPDPPVFTKSDYERGKARWLVVFNGTRPGREGGRPRLSIEAPTLGLRSEEWRM